MKESLRDGAGGSEGVLEIVSGVFVWLYKRSSKLAIDDVSAVPGGQSYLRDLITCDHPFTPVSSNPSQQVHELLNKPKNDISLFGSTSKACW